MNQADVWTRPPFQKEWVNVFKPLTNTGDNSKYNKQNDAEAEDLYYIKLWWGVRCGEIIVLLGIKSRKTVKVLATSN